MDERMLYALDVYEVDQEEGIIVNQREAFTTSLQGIEFIDGTLWASDNFFDAFFTALDMNPIPEAMVVQDDPLL
jgi:hypothetical protein